MRSTTLAAILAVAFAAGCGGSSPSAHDVFVAKANTICAKAQERAKELGKRTGGASSRDFFTPAQALIAVTGLALSRVQPPAAQRAAYQQFLASVRREAGYVAALGRYERKKNRSAAHAVLAKMKANPVNSEARALGLAKCAQTVEPAG